MKKIMCILVATIAFMVAVPTQAQFRWGIKAGVNLNKLKLTKDMDETLNVRNMTGFFVGPMAELSLPVTGLGLDASLLYSMKGFKYDEVGENGKLLGEKSNRQHSIEVPVHVKYAVGLGDMASVFVFTGPNFIFNLKSDDIRYVNMDVFSRKNAEMGLNVGLGAKLINHLQIAANYNIPLTKTGSGKYNLPSTSKEMYSGKNKNWQISLTYLF